VLIRIFFYIFIGYLVFQVIRLILIANKAIKSGTLNMNSGNMNSNIKKEKDISRVAKILDEKRPEKKSRKF
jgi:hypothetical protein